MAHWRTLDASPPRQVMPRPRTRGAAWRPREAHACSTTLHEPRNVEHVATPWAARWCHPGSNQRRGVSLPANGRDATCDRSCRCLRTGVTWPATDRVAACDESLAPPDGSCPRVRRSVSHSTTRVAQGTWVPCRCPHGSLSHALTGPAESATGAETTSAGVAAAEAQDRCRLTDRFLAVREDLRTCKIRLPFDRDAVLSLILRKALRHAVDTKITDPSIARQFHGGGVQLQ